MFSYYHLNRANIVTVSRSRVNHYNYIGSLRPINIINDRPRTSNFSTQDLDYITWQYLLCDSHTQKLTDKVQKLNINLPIWTKTLLADYNMVLG